MPWDRLGLSLGDWISLLDSLLRRSDNVFVRRYTPFLILVAFSWWSSEESVAIALQACLGGSAECFNVIKLYDFGFKFSVCSKAVGLHIYFKRKFICQDFYFYFSLWGNGGPNWQRESKLWCSDLAWEWTTVQSRKKVRPITTVSGKAKSFLRNATRQNHRGTIGDPVHRQTNVTVQSETSFLCKYC